MIVGIDPATRKVTLSATALGLVQHIVVPKSERARELSEIRNRMLNTFARWESIEKIERIYLEEAVVAGARNLRTSLSIAETVGAVLTLGLPTTKVAVSSWKKATIGNGNATKEDVAKWYLETYPEGLNPDNQDVCDASGICDYGRQDMALAKRVRERGLN